MRTPLKIFLTGVLISLIAFSNSVLDSTLLPRFLFLAITCGLTFILISRQKTAIGFNLPVIVYGSFCAFVIAGIVYSVNKSEAVFEAARTVLGFLCFVITIHFLKTDKAYFLKYLQRISIMMVITGAVVALWQSKKYDSSLKDSIYVISGLNGHKNLFASFLFLNLFLLLLETIETNRIWKYLRIGAIALTLIILILIKTKAVYLGLLTAGLIYLLFFLLRRKTIRLPGIALMSLIAMTGLNFFILFAVPKIIDRTLDYNIALADSERQQKELDNERIVLWQKTFGVFEKHKLLGTGPGNWQIHFPNETLKGMWRAEDLNFTFQRPHNDLLWILSETGLIGFNLYFLFIVLVIFSLVLSMQRTTGKHPLILCIAFITGYFVISFFDFPKERMEHILLLNILTATGYHFTSEIIPFKSLNIKPVFSFVAAALSVVLIIIGIYRIRGELNLRLLYQARYKGEQGKVLTSEEKSYSSFYSLDPTSVPLKWYSGNAHAANGNYEKAFEDFKRAYRDNPYNRNVLNDLGSAYAMLGKNDSAKILYLEAARISPRFDDAKLNLTAIYIREQKFKSADSCLNTLLHDSPRRSQYQATVNALLGKKN